MPVPQPQLRPKVRRRQWRDEENRLFEEWITKNPKPTADEKYRYTESQIGLGVQQLQNKINNWRNRRNVQKGIQ
jgi:hypothetical protein